MTDLLKLDIADGINTITLDDGKANAMSVDMLDQLHAALDEAEKSGGPVVIKGREGVFSAGFDLGVFKSGDQQQIFNMLESGARLTQRLLSFPNPTVCACTGHAIAMGAFILLSTDYRVGVDGQFKFAANEVAIGLTVPRFATEVCRGRLNPAALNFGLPIANYFNVTDAKLAGFLDAVVPADGMAAHLDEALKMILQLDLPSHTATKLRVRESMFSALEEAIHQDCADWSARVPG